MPNGDTEWITTKEAAELTGYTAQYFRKAIYRGALRGRKFGRDWFLDKGEVLDYKERMDRLGTAKHSPWREDLAEQGRGRKDNDARPEV